MEKLLAFLTPALIYLLIFVLHAVMPGRWVEGYVTRTNSTERLRYRLNGLLVLFSVLVICFLLCYVGFIAWDWLYEYSWYTLAGAIAIGLVFSSVLVLSPAPVKNSFFTDFYLGRLENPQLWDGRIDAKMWLYLVGAVMLELNVLSFTAHHYTLYGTSGSPGIYLSTALFSFFVLDYLMFEEVHLYTYDFLAERVGFKLGFGCLAFYPYFYSIPVWSVADLQNPHSPGYLLILYVLIFFVSWIFSRGANLQKYFFKKDPKKPFLGIKPEVLTDGNMSLLVNGFWGLSRHINYLGEIGMAIGIVLCTGYPTLFWPWLYPIYYIALLFPRQIADDKRCSKKYGALWTAYVKKVPYRIIPYIY